jgi:DNA-binding transcriptional MocR family regulator
LYYDLAQEETVGLEGLPRSFLSMDTENRVIRLDSFSKLLCPGFRMGMVAGPPVFIEKYILLQEVMDQVSVCRLYFLLFLSSHHLILRLS